jgi:tRNA A-37 threonylcarbamoyl transferase component Bud32
MLPANRILKTIPEPRDLFVTEIREFTIESRGGGRRVTQQLPGMSTVADLERQLSGQFPGCKCANRQGLILEPTQVMSDIDGVLIAVPSESQGSVRVQLFDLDVMEFAVDLDASAADLLKCLCTRLSLNYSEGIGIDDAVRIGPDLVLRNVRGSLRYVNESSLPRRLRSPLASDWVLDFRDLRDVGLIGGGRFAEVRLMENARTRERIAMKMLVPPKDDQVDRHRTEELFIREMEILLKLDHPCVLAFKGYVLPRSRSDSFKIGTEYIQGGSLAPIISSGPSWWDCTAKSIVICGFVHGMQYIHSLGVIHRDLKPSNILVDEEHEIRIADFGASQFEAIHATQTIGSGTPFYMAPEQYAPEYDNKVDVYAFGLVLYEVVTGQRVFPDDYTIPQLYGAAVSGRRPTIPDSVSVWVRELISRCWSPDPATRPSFDDIVADCQCNSFALDGSADVAAITRYARRIQST